MKRFVCFLLIIVMGLSLCACTEMEQLYGALKERFFGDKIIAEQQQILKIGFSRVQGDAALSQEDKIEHIMTLEQLLAYENEYADYRSGIIFDTLTETEQNVFIALEYAMVNSYNYIFIDRRITDDESAASRILEYLSFESPFLEQNIVGASFLQTGYYEHEISKNYSIRIPMRSTCVSVDNFRQELWEKKMKALKEAQKVFERLNTGGSKLELIERLYTYVATTIEYESGSGKTRLVPYLYDAFVTKKTNCDGYSNALALLLSMANIKNLEKADTQDVEEGHTWNCFEYKGKWYNCDATGGEWIPKGKTSMGSGLMFGFADYLQESRHDHFARFPECSEPLYMKPAAEVSVSRGSEFFEAINKGFVQGDKVWSLVIVDTLDKNGLQPQLQKLANRYQLDLYAHFLKLSDGRHAILIYKDGTY